MCVCLFSDFGFASFLLFISWRSFYSHNIFTINIEVGALSRGAFLQHKYHCKSSWDNNNDGISSCVPFLSCEKPKACSYWNLQVARHLSAELELIIYDNTVEELKEFFYYNFF